MDDLEMHSIMGEALVARGLASTADVAADRASLEARLAGVEVAPQAAESPASSQAPAAPSHRTADLFAQAKPSVPAEGVTAFDAEMFAGPETPAGYNFGPAPKGVEISLEQESTFRSFFHGEGVPAAIGNEVGRLWNAAVANPPTAVEMEIARQEGHASVHRIWGADTERNLAVAQAEVARMAKSRPEIIDMLEQSGLGNNAWLAVTLFNLAKAKGRA